MAGGGGFLAGGTIFVAGTNGEDSLGGGTIFLAGTIRERSLGWGVVNVAVAIGEGSLEDGEILGRPTGVVLSSELDRFRSEGTGTGVCFIGGTII